MQRIALVIRLLVAIAFLFFGVNFFYPFLKFEVSLLPPPALAFMGALSSTEYLKVIKILEVVGGGLLLTGRFAPLGLVILTPISVNILLWDLCLVEKPGLGIVLTVLCVFLLWFYRKHFVGILMPAAVI